MGVRLRLALAVSACLLPSAIAVGPASATSAARPSAVDPATELAQRYAPVVRLVEQEDPPCGDGEAFEPLDVNVVLGNPEVALRGPWSGQNVVKVGPTAEDISVGLFGYHLDFPGDALKP